MYRDGHGYAPGDDDGNGHYCQPVVAVEHKYNDVTCSYLPTPTPLDNYYQCYETNDGEDDDITIITPNTVENSRSKLNDFAEHIK